MKSSPPRQGSYLLFWRDSGSKWSGCFNPSEMINTGGLFTEKDTRTSRARHGSAEVIPRPGLTEKVILAENVTETPSFSDMSVQSRIGRFGRQDLPCRIWNLYLSESSWAVHVRIFNQKSKLGGPRRFYSLKEHTPLIGRYRDIEDSPKSYHGTATPLSKCAFGAKIGPNMDSATFLYSALRSL